MESWSGGLTDWWIGGNSLLILLVGQSSITVFQHSILPFLHHSMPPPLHRSTTPSLSPACVGNLPEKPGAGVGPMALGSRGGNAEDLRGLFDRQADEIAELDEFGLLLVVGGEPVQGVVDSQHLVVFARRSDFELRDVEPLLAAAMPLGV